MVCKRQWTERQDSTLPSVVKGTALKATGHYRVAKFHAGQLLYNRKTKEDGFICRVFADRGIIMYEVWVPKEPNSWKAGYWISRWFELVLKLSGNECLGSPSREDQWGSEANCVPGD
jgi:hypothetical protein